VISIDDLNLSDWRAMKEKAVFAFEFVMKMTSPKVFDRKDFNSEDRKAIDNIRDRLSGAFESLVESIEWEREIGSETGEEDAGSCALNYFNLSQLILACVYSGTYLEASDPVKRALKSELAALSGATGGKKSGETRRARRTWVTHAEELAREYVTANPGASQIKIAVEITNGWKCKYITPPELETLKKHVKAMIDAGQLPKRVTKQLRMGK
jgi:hypothetical protein